MTPNGASGSEEEEIQPMHQEQLDSVVELAQLCHFCTTFRTPLKLPLFSRTEIQSAMIAGTKGDDEQLPLLAEVHYKLTHQSGAKMDKMVQDWEKAVIRKTTEHWRLTFSSNPFEGGRMYNDLTLTQRALVLNTLCHWKLDNSPEILKYLAVPQKENETNNYESLRACPIGYDDQGATYWYFNDRCWVYAEDPSPDQLQNRSSSYAVEFADAKRIRLSIDFDASSSANASSTSSVQDTSSLVLALHSPEKENRRLSASSASKMDINTLIADASEEDEPFVKDTKEGVVDNVDMKEEDTHDNTTKLKKVVVENVLMKEEETMAKQTNEKSMEVHHQSSNETDSKGDWLTSEPKQEVKVEEAHNKLQKEDTKEEIVVKEEKLKDCHEQEESTKIRRMSVDEEDVENTNGARKKQHVEQEEPTTTPTKTTTTPTAGKRKSTRWAAPISSMTTIAPEPTSPLKKKARVDTEPVPISNKEDAVNGQSSHTSQTLVDHKANNATSPVLVPTVLEDGTEDFDILCAACKRSYDRRYLDPPLDKRPMGEWRCFECLVNDARGWPRRRPSPASKSSTMAVHEVTETKKTKSKSKSSSSSSRRKNASSSSSKSKSSSSTKKKSSSASSKHKKSSKRRSSRSSSTSGKKSSSSSSKSSSKSKHKHSSRHHSNSSRHRDEYEKLLTVFQTRKRERMMIEDGRRNGAHLCPIALKGPTKWRVVSSSLDTLLVLTETLKGGSLEQERLRGRLIVIMKEQEKQEEERLKKREAMWSILSRRQSSRIATTRIKSQRMLSGDDTDDDNEQSHDDDDDGGRLRRRPTSMGTRRSSRRSTMNGGDSKNRLASERESRARRRQRIMGSDDEDDEEQRDDEDDENDDPEDSDNDDGGKGKNTSSIRNWIDWSHATGDKRLTAICAALVSRLLQEEMAELFSQPVDPEQDGCPDYLTVIKHPIDLGTIRARSEGGDYKTWDDFKVDLGRVWSNCRLYNPPDTLVVQYADALEAMGKTMIKEAERKGGLQKSQRSQNRGSNGDNSVNNEEDGHDNDDDEGDKAKSDSESSASEDSSHSEDDSDDAVAASASSDDEVEIKKSNKRGATTTPSRTRASAGGRPARSARSTASSSNTRNPRRRNNIASDSEEEDSDDLDLGSDESETKPKKSKKPNQTTTRPIVTGRSPSSIIKQAQAKAEAANMAKTTKVKKHDHHDSSDSSASSSSSSSDDDSGSEIDQPTTTARSVGTAPPPPISPPPPPPPSSAPSSTSKKPRSKPSHCSNPSKPPPSPTGSSSSYFSSSSDGGSDDSSSSDSDSA